MLTFDALADANARRAKQWNKTGAEIPLLFSLVELAGEAGEACNAGKKMARAEYGLVGAVMGKQDLIEELADVVICVDLVARKLGIDLGAAVARKFNLTSRKHGFTVLLPEPVAPPAS